MYFYFLFSVTARIYHITISSAMQYFLRILKRILLSVVVIDLVNVALVWYKRRYWHRFVPVSALICY